MKREVMLAHVNAALERLEAGHVADARHILENARAGLVTRPHRKSAPIVGTVDADLLAALREAYSRAQAGTITTAEIADLVLKIERERPADVLALARAFGCTWLAPRASRRAAAYAIEERLVGPIHARERSTF